MGGFDMSATGLDDIMAKLGPDRQVAWHVLGAVLHALRDRLQIGLAVHLGAQLPLLVRGLYYDQWHPSEQTLKQRSAEQFLDHVSQRLTGIRPVNVKDATHVTFQVLNHYLDPHQVDKVRQALPESVRATGISSRCSAARRPRGRSRRARSSPSVFGELGCSWEFPPTIQN